MYRQTLAITITRAFVTLRHDDDVYTTAIRRTYEKNTTDIRHEFDTLVIVVVDNKNVYCLEGS